MAAEIKVFENYSEFCKTVSSAILALSQKTIQEKGHFSLVLSGGKTPRGVYEAMARESRFEWQRIHLFLGDERWAALTDPASNYRMIKETLLDRIRIPSENINPIRTEEIDPETSAAFYEEDLKAFFKEIKQKEGRFDLILLGAGADGHTASIFPGSKTLRETQKWVVPTKGPQGQTRLTLTLPAINQAEMIFVLIAGAGKRDLIKQVYNQEERDLTLPIFQVTPYRGGVKWFVHSMKS